MATLYDNYSGTAEPYNALTLDNANDWAGQSFTTTVPFSLSRIDIWIRKLSGDNVGTIIVALYAVDGSGHPTGVALASGTIDDSAISDSTYAWIPCTLSSAYNVSASTKYAIVVHGTALDASNVIIWSYDDNGSGASDFAGGDLEWSTNGGSSWSTTTTGDLLFRCYGNIAPSSDKTYSRALIAIGNHEFWYESSTSTLTELTAANADINTVNPLTAVEAYQKVFIANKTNLKVADFLNTKIATADVGANPPDFGTVLTGGSSGAEMIVDYITTLSSACTIYGKRITTATFSSGETVTGTDDDDNAISFATSAVETAPPHWYDWTAFGGDSSFGALPASAYLVALYRGRLVLAGHPDYPNMWYMSKIANPWKWIYEEDDRLTAVSGNNVKAGEVGDIIRALIPFGDDYFIFGCASSIHLLDGDPADNGSIDKLSGTTGIYSWTAWCKDAEENLYFFGRDGVYKMTGGRSKPVNISRTALPKLVLDWALDPSLHRVVLTYDAKRQGILITKTTLSDGTCVGYFYSLETEGFYPVTFQTQNGIFCAYDYNSDTPTDRALLFGCNDGYLRSFLDTAKDDDTGASDTAINSYFGMVEPITEDFDREGVLTSLTVEMAGGASGGDFSDSDGCSYEYHSADDSETALEDLKDGATAWGSGTLSGTGRKSRIRSRIRGAWLGLKFYNSTASETFGINKLFGIIKQVGRIK